MLARFTPHFLLFNPDVVSSTFRLPVTEVPASSSSHFRMYFDLDLMEGEQRHVIAINPLINNTEVLHHMAVYGCRKEQGIHTSCIHASIFAIGRFTSETYILT